MDPVVLCCSLFKALTLDPVPVIGDMVYIPAAEGFKLRDLKEELVNTACPAHRYSFGHAVRTLRQHAFKETRCSCESVSCSKPRKDCLEEQHVAPFVPDATGNACMLRGGARRGTNAGSGSSGMLWAYELDTVVMAHSWLMRNRSLKYPRCCGAMLVYQLKKSPSLPPGLYVYRTHPRHFGCIVERPLTVVEQFNFDGHQKRFSSRGEELPGDITIDMFPGHENLSALYVINRNLAVSPREYGNRMYGEARALDLITRCSTPPEIACEYHEVAVRTERMCVIDLRWRAFDTKTSCINAIPKLRGLQAVVWSNHSNNVQDIECKVLAWLFSQANELPNEVQMVDHRNELHGIRYILMDMDTFHVHLPEPPSRNESFFMHTSFTGDVDLATSTIGRVSGNRSRMGSPCPNSLAFSFWYSLPGLRCFQPTPFSCGIKHGGASAITDGLKASLVEWTLKQDGSSCMAIAVQHTLYYHARDMKYQMMVCHTVRDTDTSLQIFRL